MENNTFLKTVKATEKEVWNKASCFLDQRFCIVTSGCVAQFVRVLNLNRKVVSSMPTLSITPSCVLGILNVSISTIGDKAQWIRAQVGNRKIVDSRFDSCVFLKEAYRQNSHNGAKQSTRGGLTKDSLTNQASCWCGRQTRSIFRCIRRRTLSTWFPCIFSNILSTLGRK